MMRAVAAMKQSVRRLRPGLALIGVLLAWALLAPGIETRLPFPATGHLWWRLAFYVVPTLLLLGWRAWRIARQDGEITPWQFGGPIALAAAVLLIGLVGTVYAVRAQDGDRLTLMAAQFDHNVQNLERALKEQLERPRDLLLSLRASQMAVDDMRRVAFARWAAARDLERDYPSVLGVGFIERVQRQHIEQFLARQRADDAPDFNIRTQGDASDLYVITRIEPRPRNRAAWGYDLGSEPVRRAALERALSTGEPALSGLITLVQGTQGKTQGLLLIVPVHDPDSDLSTVESRVASTAGFVYAPFAVDSVLRGVRSATAGMLDFEIVDTQGQGQAQRYNDSTQTPSDLAARLASASANRGALGTERAILFGGRPLGLYVWSTPQFDKNFDEAAPLRLGLVGAALSTLLASVAWLLVTGRRRAQHLALRMTEEWRQATRLADEAQREHEFLLLTMNQHCIVSMTDRRGLITYVNDAFVEIAQYSRDELVGRRHSVINSGTHPPAFWADFWATLCRGDVWQGEVCNRRKDGELYWVKSTVVPFRNAEGVIDRFVSVRTDVTAERAVRAQVQTLNQRFAIALEGGNDGLWDWANVHGQDMWWSPQMYRLLGVQPGELEASVEQLDRLVHPDHQSRVSSALATALREGSIYDVELRLRIKDGSYRWFRSRGKVFRDSDGEHHRIAGSLQDIDDLKTAQSDLRTRNAQMASIFAVAPDGFVAFGRDGLATFVSPAMEALTQRALGVYAGQQIDTVLGLMLGESGKVAESDQRMKALRGAGLELPISIVPPRTLMLRLHAASQFSEIRKLLHVRDITEQLEVERMKSDFLSTAAHELRTPMASIYGFTELMMMREMTEERRQQFLGKIYRQSRAMMNILNELLDLARIEARRGADFEFEILDLAELVREACQDFQPPDSRASPEMSLSDHAVWVRADRAKLLQTLRNLLSNAYKYSPGGGAVQVNLTTAPIEGVEFTRLEVRDHGIGMTPEQLARVTERFYRADASGAIPGTGLGMSIVKEIVELHGGGLVIESTVGESTCVVIQIPVRGAA